MSEAMIIALVDLAVKYGFPAAMTFFQGISKAKTLDDAIAALGAAHAKSLEQYIAEDAAARLKALTPPATLA